MNTHVEWQFGGWLQGLSPALAWGIMAGAALGGGVAILLLYRHTMRELSPGRRGILITLRVALLLVVLLLLANPSQVQKPTHDDQKNARRLTVLVDHSASMEAVDNRQQTRLSNALRTWKPHLEEAAQAFPRVEYRRFSEAVEAPTTWDAASSQSPAGPETQLWKALTTTLAEAPAAIVCLTDGLDTSGADAAAVVAGAQRRGVPLSFVAANNRSRPVEMLILRDVKTPSPVLRRTRFTASAIVEVSTRHEGEVPIELWSGEEMLATAQLPVRAGWNVIPWTAEVTAHEVGEMPLEFRLGSGKTQEMAASTTQVVDHKKVNVLYYQGALQWGYRFLLGALQSDPSFQVSSILNPALGVRMTAGSGLGGLADLPETAAALKPFQIVVLAHVFADQLSAKQQQALVEYAKGGGGILFIAPDSEATTRFAGTALEAMLPVVFDASTASPADAAADRFLQNMRAQLGDESYVDPTSAARTRTQILPELLPFKIPPGAKFLKPGQTVPMFSNYARTRRVKAAAQILAVHPTEDTPDHAPRVLLARQQFGTGFSAALTTDLLWRWKMSLPSSSHAAETFWQQLLLSLAPDSAVGMRLVKSSSNAAVQHVVGVLLTGANGTPEITALSPNGVRHLLVPTNTDAGWQAEFTPDLAGRWEVSALDAASNRARITLPVTAEVRTFENANLPADTDGMRKIAEATGGTLIGSEPAFRLDQALPGALASPLVIGQPFWDQPWLIALLLALYSAELITRRCFRLL